MAEDALLDAIGLPVDDGTPAAAFARLTALMARLRAPQGGCPWDLEQTFDTIAPYTLEEAYEVADAIARRDLGALREELGDLLFQVAFHSRLAEEQREFAFADVARGLVDKMVRRHPHVFGGEAVGDAALQTTLWEEQKAREKAARGHTSALDDIPLSLPALARAAKLGRRASRVGFDWPDTSGVLAKIVEEVGELQAAVASGVATDTEAELGDVLFAVVNLARHLGVDPEAALRGTNQRFEQRFRGVEQKLAAQGLTVAEAGLERANAAWDEIKRELK
jgi:MazG family protein